MVGREGGQLRGRWGAFGAPQLQDLKGTQLMAAGNISPLPHPDRLQDAVVFIASHKFLTEGLKHSNK